MIKVLGNGGQAIGTVLQRRWQQRVGAVIGSWLLTLGYSVFVI
jgi:hypothetical protein